MISLKIILLIPFLSIAIAMIICYFGREKKARSLKLLIEKSAFDEACALSTAECGISAKSLASISRSCDIIRFTEDNSGIYLPEEKKIKAERLWLGKKYSLLFTVILIIAAAAVFIGLYFLLPLFLDLEGLNISL